jgi:hypothetical protein
LRSTAAGSYAQHKWILHLRDSIGCLFRLQTSVWATWPVDGPHFFVGLLCSTRDVALCADRLEQGSAEGARQVERRRQESQGRF